MTLSRRDFVAVAGASVAAACTRHVNTAVEPTHGATILFQGDSITDAGRDRNHPAPNSTGALGCGYPMLLAATMLKQWPDLELRIFNRGISGNKVPDLQARWEADTLALKPDILSILIGVNDYWHTRTHDYTGTVADYETQFAALLAQTHVPKTIVLEPFVLKTGAVDASWWPEFDARRAAAARVAERAGAVFVPLQQAFEQAAAKNGPAYWLADGVHPTPAGHELIADRWREVSGILPPAS